MITETETETETVVVDHFPVAKTMLGDVVLPYHQLPLHKNPEMYRPIPSLMIIIISNDLHKADLRSNRISLQIDMMDLEEDTNSKVRINDTNLTVSIKEIVVLMVAIMINIHHHLDSEIISIRIKTNNLLFLAKDKHPLVISSGTMVEVGALVEAEVSMMVEVVVV
jgi:hypothetical protein